MVSFSEGRHMETMTLVIRARFKTRGRTPVAVAAERFQWTSPGASWSRPLSRLRKSWISQISDELRNTPQSY